jgi:hypothetical protein
VVTSHRLLLLLAAFASAAGCGLKGDPLPPLIRVADTTTDLGVVQQGNNAVLVWSYPSMTSDGGPLPDLESVEVWRTTLPVGLEPRETSRRDRQIRYQLLEAQGDVLVTLDTAGLARATRGPMLEFRDDLERWRKIHGTEQDWVIWYAVRTICCRGRPSAFSNIARLEPQIPPPPPSGLTATPSADGVDLAWQAEPGTGVIVERAGEIGGWTSITSDPVSDNTVRDETAAQGESWRYRARSVRDLPSGGRVLGEAGDTVEIEYADVYPPAPPANLICLPEAERVRIRWQSSAEVVWYRIERRVGGPEWTPLARRHRGVEYEDSAPPIGRITYSVRAVDAGGNLSDRATCEALISASPDDG